MSAPDRPTREQAAHPGSRMVGESYKDHSARAFGMLRAAEVDLAEARAEVRALRAELGMELGMRTAAVDELETLRSKLWALLGADQLSDDDTVDGLRAALVARTPRPAEPVTYICDQSRHAVVPCSRCEPVTPAPLPAVPDGEDAACMNCGLPLGSPEAWGQAQVGPVHHGCPDDAEAGEDVPARLDAAADALAAADLARGAAALRDAASVASIAGPDVRAAVAAALARPTGGQE